MLNVRLTLVTFLSVFLFPFTAMAQNETPAVTAKPVTEVMDEKLPVLAQAPVVVELFSSQACVFCPRADALFNDMISDETVIGLSCHVDYFDVRQGALSQRFCTDLQTKYAQQLASGPNYTPQIVVNGKRDVVGYKFDKVLSTLKSERLSTVKRLTLSKGTDGTYTIVLPEEIAAGNNEYRLMVYDKPREITIAEGRNKGKKMTYKNIVSVMEPITPQDGILKFKPESKAIHAGFVVLSQDIVTGAITAVVQQKFHSLQ